MSAAFSALLPAPVPFSGTENNGLLNPGKRRNEFYVKNKLLRPAGRHILFFLRSGRKNILKASPAKLRPNNAFKSSNTTPHEGYQILKRWAVEKPHGYFVFTSNVDGHFQKAGFEEKRVYEVHGTLERMQCVHDCHHQSWTAKDFQPEVDNANLRLTSPYPRCPFCGGLARQNVLMFDDWFYNSNYQDLKRTSLEQWIKGVPNLVVIELGAGKAIPTVRYFSERTAKAKKAGFIRINPQDGGVSKHHFLGLDMTALEALKAIDVLLNQST